MELIIHRALIKMTVACCDLDEMIVSWCGQSLQVDSRLVSRAAKDEQQSAEVTRFTVMVIIGVKESTNRVNATTYAALLWTSSIHRRFDNVGQLGHMLVQNPDFQSPDASP